MLGLTPLSSAYSSLSYAARHSHSANLPITSPNSSKAADQTSAEMKLAIWCQITGLHGARISR
jgi:hypothetical protein